MRTDNKKNVLLRFFTVLGLCLVLPTFVHARVSGQCANCHTMHNSQDGTGQVHIGTGAGWTGGVLVGPAGSPQGQLLKTDCVGCHSSTDSDNIVNGTTPIVWNIGGTQASDLAAGNFSWVAAAGGEGNGHNVLGISAAADSILATAPGLKNAGCANSCHISLFTANTSATLTGDTGCKGCHLHTGHHDAESNGGVGPLGGGGDAYRFLGSHSGINGIVSNNSDTSGGGPAFYLEDPAWTTNTYMSQNWLDANDPGNMSVGTFCTGCHDAFHAAGGPGDADPLSGEINQNASGAWLRHPTNVNIPNAGEFAAIMTQPYNPDIPLARAVTNTGDSIWSDDQVMCLSCHKAHGTAYKDALRFSYSTIIAHTGGPNRTDGCFFCHRAKDD